MPRKLKYFFLLFVLAIGLTKTDLAFGTANASLPKTFAHTSRPIAKTSVIIERIGDFDYDEDTYGASLWITSVTTAPSGDPLEGLEIANSVSTRIENRSTSSIGNTHIYRERLTGVFTHPWDLSRYPFDREKLQLILKDTEESPGNFIHTADSVHSGLRGLPERIGEWRIQGYSFLNEKTKSKWLTASMGVLTPVPKEQHISSMVFTLDLANAHTKGALKLLAGGIIAAGITAVSYTLTPNIISNPNSRFGALSASLFASVISMRSAYGYLGNIETLTYIDTVYLLILVYIFFAFACTSHLWRLNKNPDLSGLIQTYSFNAGIISTAVLLTLIAISTMQAFLGL